MRCLLVGNKVEEFGEFSGRVVSHVFEFGHHFVAQFRADQTRTHHARLVVQKCAVRRALNG